MDDEQIPDWAKTWYYDNGFAEAEKFWRFVERERIIKMLENELETMALATSISETREEMLDLHGQWQGVVQAIALIKGEK